MSMRYLAASYGQSMASYHFCVSNNVRCVEPGELEEMYCISEPASGEAHARTLLGHHRQNPDGFTMSHDSHITYSCVNRF